VVACITELFHILSLEATLSAYTQAKFPEVLACYSASLRKP